MTGTGKGMTGTGKGMTSTGKDRYRQRQGHDRQVQADALSYGYRCRNRSRYMCCRYRYRYRQTTDGVLRYTWMQAECTGTVRHRCSARMYVQIIIGTCTRTESHVQSTGTG